MPYVNKKDAHGIKQKYKTLCDKFNEVMEEYDKGLDATFFENTAFSSEYLFNDLNSLADKINNRLESVKYETEKPVENFKGMEKDLRDKANYLQNRFRGFIQEYEGGAGGLWESERTTILNMNIWNSRQI